MADFDFDCGNSYEYKALYRKKNGEYFLHTRYLCLGGELIDSISPFSNEEKAKEYCLENNLSVPDYERIFGEVEE